MVYGQIISIIFPFVFVAAIAYIVFQIDNTLKLKRLKTIQAKASRENGIFNGNKTTGTLGKEESDGIIEND